MPVRIRRGPPRQTLALVRGKTSWGRAANARVGRKGSSSPSAAQAVDAPPANSRSADPRARPRAPPDGASARRNAGAASAPAPQAEDRSAHAHPDSAAQAAVSPARQPATDKGWRGARQANLTEPRTVLAAFPARPTRPKSAHPSSATSGSEAQVAPSARLSVCSVWGPIRVFSILPSAPITNVVGRPRSPYARPTEPSPSRRFEKLQWFFTMKRRAL